VVEKRNYVVAKYNFGQKTLYRLMNDDSASLTDKACNQCMYNGVTISRVQNMRLNLIQEHQSSYWPM
jgi:hypothetical protein